MLLVFTGGHNDVTSGREQEREAPTQRIKIRNYSHGSSVTIFIAHADVAFYFNA